MEQLISLILSCVVLFAPQARETDEAEPFYQYFDPSGELQMVLYFDAETQQGYGTRFQDGESGEFSFQETAPADGEWEDLWLEDYCVIPEEYSEGVDHYQESYERDMWGRFFLRPGRRAHPAGVLAEPHAVGDDALQPDQLF